MDNLSDFDTFKKEINEDLKNINDQYLKYLVYRMKLSYHEIMDVLDKKYIPSKRTGYTFRAGVFEVSDIKLMLKFSLPEELKANITIDDIRLKSNLKKVKH